MASQRGHGHHSDLVLSPDAWLPVSRTAPALTLPLLFAVPPWLPLLRGEGPSPSAWHLGSARLTSVPRFALFPPTHCLLALRSILTAPFPAPSVSAVPSTWHLHAITPGNFLIVSPSQRTSLEPSGDPTHTTTPSSPACPTLHPDELPVAGIVLHVTVTASHFPILGVQLPLRWQLLSSPPPLPASSSHPFLNLPRSVATLTHPQQWLEPTTHAYALTRNRIGNLSLFGKTPNQPSHMAQGSLESFSAALEYSSGSPQIPSVTLKAMCPMV